MVRRFRTPAIATAAGGILPFAFAPYSFHPVAVLSLAIFFALLKKASPTRSALIGWCFGLGMFGHGVWWVQVSLHQFGLPLYAFSVTMTVLFVAFMALFIALTGYVIAHCPGNPGACRVLLVMPSVWIWGEWLREWLLSGFPWLLLGYSQIDSWLAGYVPVLGVHGGSLAVAVLAACLTLITHKQKWPVALLAGVIVLSGWALERMAWTTPVGPKLPVTLVQGAIPQSVKWEREFRARTLEFYETLSAPHWGDSLIIWPETAVPAFPEEVPEILGRLREIASKHHTALLVGLPTGDRSGGPYFNSVVLLNAQDQHYDKHHLVPFGEYLPLDRLIRPVLNFLTIPMSSFTPGAAQQLPIRYGDLRLGVSICYEDAYADEVRKALPEANMLVNVSDDSWFGDTIAPHQHLEISRLRALESGRYLLRATNSGISAIIDERGRVTGRSPQFQPFVLTGRATARAGTTPFVRWGHGPVLLLSALGLVGAGLTQRRRSFGRR